YHCNICNMTKHIIYHIFHWSQIENRLMEVIPKIIYHIKIRILSLKNYRIRLPYQVQSYLEIVYLKILEKTCHKLNKFKPISMRYLKIHFFKRMIDRYSLEINRMI